MALDDIEISKFDVGAPAEAVEVNSAKIFSGKVFPPAQHILLFDAGDWEIFIREWAQFQKTKYQLVTQLGGAYDRGVDVACFLSNQGFLGDWDNYQCKYYKGDALTPGTAIPEIGKILWHAFQKNISLPRRYYFFAPKDCGPSLKALLLDSPKLKSKLKEQWDDWCSNTITSTKTIKLEGDFLVYVDSIDFSIFNYKPTHEVIEEHRATPYFHARFGGGLPDRPKPCKPPSDFLETESRYVTQLFEAYSDKEKVEVSGSNIFEKEKLHNHFGRQREAFFYAESLRAFARDTVPNGTFEALQEEIYSGVVDICDGVHSNGYERLSAVATAASNLILDANGLIQVTKQQDRRGICHQLANNDRLIWVTKND